ncbi:hypothetical protein [Longispora albida]|uniref:hypothetical protein n=1 Tax=Longispora albida TaxID=203523 RepID=UPI000362E500|nr:hypothetical protein [Longispora albida]
MRRRLILAAAALLAAPLAALPGGPAQALEFRSGMHTGAPFSVVMCKAADSPRYEPRSQAAMADMLINRGTSGVADYLYDQSGGRLDISASSGSAVRGWFQSTKTKAQLAAIPDRWQKIMHCMETARLGGYAIPGHHKVVAVYNVDVGDVGWHNGVLMGPGYYNQAFAAHEMLHSLGLDHAWSNDTSVRVADWAGWGEYDNAWDPMGDNKYGRRDVRWLPAPVGMSAFHRDKLGWLPRHRVHTFGANGPASGTVTLSRLGDPNQWGTNPVMVRVPISAADPGHYYTIEYRKKTGWDQGIPADQVLIHEIKGTSPYLLKWIGVPGKPPVNEVNNAQVRIRVLGTSGDTASVSITTTSAAVSVSGPNGCQAGYVWREADSYDYVCVTWATRDQTAADNRAAPSRHVPGSAWCEPGYVWREAFAGDNVCVAPAVRSQAWDDNLRRAERVA